jgi:hypothetical protein
MPGLGQLYLGRYRRAAVWMSPIVFAGIAVFVASRSSTVSIIGVALTPQALWELAADCGCFPELLNALYPFTRKWTKTYPNEVDPGMAVLRDTLSHVMGVPIGYYALVDMAAFLDLVDTINGVELYVQQPLQAEVSPPDEGNPMATVDVETSDETIESKCHA